MMLSLTKSALAALAIFVVFYFFTAFTANRRSVRQLQHAKAPMPTYHFIFGHLPALKKSIEAMPRNCTLHFVVRHLSRQFPNNGVWYLNLWPFHSKTLMVVANPFAASQVEGVRDKPAAMCKTLEVINGGPSLMTMHGATWKKWRGIFALGFAPSYMIGLAPSIAEEAAVFCDLLEKQAIDGNMFLLEEFTLRLTFDAIARVTLDARLHYQTQGSALADCLRRQIYWTPFATTFNPIKRYLSPKPLVQWYNSYRMNQYIDKEIDLRFEELIHKHTDGPNTASPRSRSIISLAMEQYLEEIGELDEPSRKAFRDLARPHLRMFLYAGHDTTSTTLLYTYLNLSRHPEILARVRLEHDKVFGPDYSTHHVTSRIAADPTLLNQIPYTLAVIKETLRIFPPAGSLRSGSPTLTLTDEKGHVYPTDDCHIWTLPLIMHDDPAYFPSPKTFDPERWLVDADHTLHPQKGSWRPFEWGPRNCIGQTLAVLELKVVLVMTARLFEVKPAYEEWDAGHPVHGITTADGERVYGAEMGGGGAHPANRFPTRVSLRKPRVGE